MDNFLKIMALPEEAAPQAVFVKSRDEGGINVLFDPSAGKELFQVFIHNTLPYQEKASWVFDDFAAARSFAARHFREWEYLSWDQRVERPCATKGVECGKGNCDECKSGGGCNSCGASELNKND